MFIWLIHLAIIIRTPILINLKRSMEILHISSFSWCPDPRKLLVQSANSKIIALLNKLESKFISVKVWENTLLPSVSWAEIDLYTWCTSPPQVPRVVTGGSATVSPSHHNPAPRDYCSTVTTHTPPWEPLRYNHTWMNPNGTIPYYEAQALTNHSLDQLHGCPRSTKAGGRYTRPSSIQWPPAKQHIPQLSTPY